MKKILQRISHIGKLFHTSRHVHPTRDWFMLLGGTALLIGVTAGWNAWVYVDSTTRTAAPRESAAVPSFDTSVVGAVQSAFAVRAEESSRYRTTYRFVDPSR